jgi:hypothetical protein
MLTLAVQLCRFRRNSMCMHKVGIQFGPVKHSPSAGVIQESRSAHRLCSTSTQGGALLPDAGSRSFRKRVTERVCLLKNAFCVPIPSPWSTCTAGAKAHFRWLARCGQSMPCYLGQARLCPSGKNKAVTCLHDVAWADWRAILKVGGIPCDCTLRAR